MKCIGTIAGAIVTLVWVMAGVWIFYNDTPHWEQAYWMSPFAVVIGGLLGSLFDIGRSK